MVDECNVSDLVPADVAKTVCGEYEQIGCTGAIKSASIKNYLIDVDVGLRNNGIQSFGLRSRI